MKQGDVTMVIKVLLVSNNILAIKVGIVDMLEIERDKSSWEVAAFSGVHASKHFAESLNVRALAFGMNSNRGNTIRTVWFSMNNWFNVKSKLGNGSAFVKCFD